MNCEVTFKKRTYTQDRGAIYTEIKQMAKFLAWGLDTEEGYGSWSCGIVELEDGSIKLIHAESIRFLGPQIPKINKEKK
jgi:hypothetical protein